MYAANGRAKSALATRERPPSFRYTPAAATSRTNGEALLQWCGGDEAAARERRSN